MFLISQRAQFFSFLPARSAGALLRMSTKKQTADRPDTATLEARRKRNAKMPKDRFQNRSSTFFKRPTSYLKRKHFRRKMADSKPISFLKREHFRRKMANLRPISYLKKEYFRALLKRCNLARTTQPLQSSVQTLPKMTNVKARNDVYTLSIWTC